MKEDFKEKVVKIKNSTIEYFSSLIYEIKSIKKHNIWDFLKKRYKLLGVLALIILLFSGYFVGRINTSKNSVLSKLEVALKDSSNRKLASVVKFKGNKVNKKDLEPLIDYYEGNTSKVDSVIRKLKNGEETEDFKLESDKRILGTKYYLSIKPYNLKVNSNFTEGKFSIDSKNYIYSGEEFNEQIPGIYNVNGILKSDYGDIKSSKEVILMKNEEAQINFSAININVNSIYDDAELYINGENSGILLKDAKDIGPFPSDGSVEVSLEKDFPWGRIKGEEVAIKDIPNINLKLNIENENMKKTILSNVDTFYNSVFDALNEEDKEKIKGSTNGTKDKIFEILEKKYFILKNKYEIKDISIINDKSQYRYKDETYRATIVVKVDYSISKKFLGINKKEDSKMFFTKVAYDDGSWIIEDIENFSL